MHIEYYFTQCFYLLSCNERKINIWCAYATSLADAFHFEAKSDRAQLISERQTRWTKMKGY